MKRMRERRPTPRDLGLAHASGTDHENVLWFDLGTQAITDLHAAPAIAQRNGHRTLGGVLPDNVFVEFLDDFTRSHGGHKKLYVGRVPHPASEGAIRKVDAASTLRQRLN